VAPDFPQPIGNVRGDVAASPGQYTVPDGGTSLDGGRVSLLVKPTDRLSVTGSVLIQRIHSDDPSLADSTPGGRTFYQPFDIQEPSTDLVKVYSIVGKYSLNFMDITSASSVIDRQTSQTSDTTEELSEAFALTSFVPSSFLEQEKTHEFNQELRFSSNGGGPLRWVVGGYYSDYRAIDFQTGSFDGLEVGGTSNIFTGTRRAHISQIAGFGEATYQVTPQIEVTAGVRGFQFRNNNTQAQYGIVANGSGDPTSAQLVTASTVSSGVSPKFSVDYKPTRDLMLYATIAKGFRAGDSNFPIPITGPDSCSGDLSALGIHGSPAGFAPDSVWSYEAGEKAKLFGNRLTFNASVYYIDWSNVQQTVFLGCGYRFIANEGNAVSYGTEGEASFKVTPWLTLQQSLSHNKSSLTANTPSTGGIKGQQLEDSPEWTAFSAIVAQREISDKWSLYGRIQNTYTSEEVDDPVYGPRPAYSIQSARVGLIGKDYSIFLYVNNIGNNRAILAHDYSIAVNIPERSRNLIEQPRTIGIDLQFHPF
jgi:iron complex outermembrane recepter protein